MHQEFGKVYVGRWVNEVKQDSFDFQDLFIGSYRKLQNNNNPLIKLRSKSMQQEESCGLRSKLTFVQASPDI